MRFDINLARRPAENLRRTWMIWGGLLAACFALFLVLATATIAGLYVRFKEDREVANLRREEQPLRADEARYMKTAAEPRIRAALERAAYLNRLIDQKGISWTRLFERLEALMPARVQLISLRPGSQRGQTDVTMIVAAGNLDEATEFVRKLEHAPDFAQPAVDRYMRSQEQQNEPPRVILQITASYNPHALAAAIEDSSQLAETGNAGEAAGEQGDEAAEAQAGEASSEGDTQAAGGEPAQSASAENSAAAPSRRRRSGGPR